MTQSDQLTRAAFEGLKRLRVRHVTVDGARLTFTGTAFVMEGPTGKHTLHHTSPRARVNAHWLGFLATTLARTSATREAGCGDNEHLAKPATREAGCGGNEHPATREAGCGGNEHPATREAGCGGDERPPKQEG